MNEYNSENEAIATIVKQLHKPIGIDIDDARQEGRSASLLIVPSGMAVHDAEPWLEASRPHPKRITGTATFTDLASLITHTKRFCGSDSTLYADAEGPRLVAVLNYHGAVAGWTDHRGQYLFPFSKEWLAWQERASEEMSLVDFASFLEDHVADVIEPNSQTAKEFAALHHCEFATASRLMELARGLSIHVAAKVAEHKNLASGEGHVTFQTEHQDQTGAALRIPSAFMLGIPVFEQGVRYQIPVRLRYRVINGAIRWAFALHRTDQAFENAFREACSMAAEQTGLQLLYGTPER